MKNKYISVLDKIACAAYIKIDGDAASFTDNFSINQLEDFEGNPDDEEIMYVNWTYDGLEFMTKFTRGAFSNAIVKGNTVTLEDYEGDVTTIEVFDIVPKNLVDKKAKINTVNLIVTTNEGGIVEEKCAAFLDDENGNREVENAMKALVRETDPDISDEDMDCIFEDGIFQYGHEDMFTAIITHF